MSKHELEGGMDMDAMQMVYAKTLYTLRETRKALLRQYGVDSEIDLLEKIRCGQASEHPAYDHYLGSLIVEQTRQQLRAEIAAQLGGALSDEAPDLSVHLMLKDRLEAKYAQRMTEPVRMAQDALLLSFDNGLLMEVRYANAGEYAMSWSWGDAELRIDTAPVHAECGTAPHHLHRDDGTVTADPLTSPGSDCWLNFSRLLDALLADPLLG
jgi:hypothetical protein